MWDVVVITTADGTQREAFLAQIQDKQERGELPLGLPIHVVADPPGTRIGEGLFSLNMLMITLSILFISSTRGQVAQWIACLTPACATDLGSNPGPGSAGMKVVCYSQI